jgi:hypothetical protein
MAELFHARLATTAEPVYPSIAIVDCDDEGVEGCRAFVDGGLWANNPVFIGLVDALSMAPPDQPIEIFCLGTCPRPTGEQVARTDVHRDLAGWKFGAPPLRCRSTLRSSRTTTSPECR